MGDDMTPSDVEPNGGPCREAVIIDLDEYRNNPERKLKLLREQYAVLKAEEDELERKKQVLNDIAHLREKIKERGEIPCA